MAYNFPTYQYPAYPNNSYQQQYSQAIQPTQYQQPSSYTQPQNQSLGIVWVDGEVGAKAYQLPAGWPANAPMPLWDTNDTVIYLKSTNQMGMPNPLQKVHYTMDEQPRMSAAMSSQPALPEATSQPVQMPDMTKYATRDDLERFKEEIKAAVASGNAEMKGGRTNGKSAV